jgi:hypothetical protein
MMLPCLVPAFAGFLLPAALLGALLLSEFAAGCGLLGRVAPLAAVVVTFFSVLSPAEASPSQTTSVTERVIRNYKQNFNKFRIMNLAVK